MLEFLLSFFVFFLPWALFALAAAWATVFVVNLVSKRRMPDIAVVWVWLIYLVPIWNSVMR